MRRWTEDLTQRSDWRRAHGSSMYRRHHVLAALFFLVRQFSVEFKTVAKSEFCFVFNYSGMLWYICVLLRTGAHILFYFWENESYLRIKSFEHAYTRICVQMLQWTKKLNPSFIEAEIWQKQDTVLAQPLHLFFFFYITNHVQHSQKSVSGHAIGWDHMILPNENREWRT